MVQFGWTTFQKGQKKKGWWRVGVGAEMHINYGWALKPKN